FPTFSENYHLQPGNVFTIEPGLYYPDRGFGVRIEDTVYLNDAGELEILTDCPYDLVIQLAP
ncbi:MAG: M24 family metallopeptidase, partial [Anaerolineae bacterium]|nr:M24 family metallopeptidase [Anaerolineae bacterium]